MVVSRDDSRLMCPARGAALITRGQTSFRYLEVKVSRLLATCLWLLDALGFRLRAAARGYAPGALRAISSAG